MQKERVMLRAAGGIPYELTRGRVKRLNLHVRRDGTVALSIPLRTTLEAADAYVIERFWPSSSQPPSALNTLSRHMIRLAMAGFRSFWPRI